MKQISRNNLLVNFEQILRFASQSKFPKICDFCGELFEANLCLSKYYRFNSIRCPICQSMYYPTYNELNDFWYLEFAKSPEDYVS